LHSLPLSPESKVSPKEPAISFKQLGLGAHEEILDPDMQIIDAHHHLFKRPALTYMFEDYLADANAGHRIVATVYVEASAFYRAQGPEHLRPLGEIEFANGTGAIGASGLFGDCRLCAAIVGYTDFRAGDAIEAYLDRAVGLAPDRLRGIRQVAIDDPTSAPYRYIPLAPPRGLLKHSDFRRGYRHLSRYGLCFEAAVFHHQLADVQDLADAFPETTIVINHCGQAMLMEMDGAARNEAFAAWASAMRACAKRPNILCKVGGLGLPFWGFGFEERADAIGYEELASAWRPFVETTIECFGADRCMMESDYPIDGRSGGFVPLWNALKHIVRAASLDEKTALFRHTAARVYGIDLQNA
jgi:L-fuconolactonase